MPATSTSHKAAFYDAFESFDIHSVFSPNTSKHPLDDDSKSVERPTKKICTSTRRISCKARGLSSAHNKDTAFFTIPEDAPHGLIVSCSHQECFGTGRSFRYCKVCDCPVAKRNFLKRHGHDLIHTTAQLKEEVDDKHCWVPPPPVAATECYPVDSNDQTSRPQQVRRHSRIISFDGQNHNLFDEEEKRTPTKLSDDEKTWLRLLRQRPQLENDVAMSKWLERVLEHSESQKISKRDVVPQSPNTQIPINTACNTVNPLSIGLPLSMLEAQRMPEAPIMHKMEPEGLFDGVDFSSMFD